jgi:hypothetical protein
LHIAPILGLDKRPNPRAGKEGVLFQTNRTTDRLAAHTCLVGMGLTVVRYLMRRKRSRKATISSDHQLVDDVILVAQLTALLRSFEIYSCTYTVLALPASRICRHIHALIDRSTCAHARLLHSIGCKGLFIIAIAVNAALSTAETAPCIGPSIGVPPTSMCMAKWPILRIPAWRNLHLPLRLASLLNQSSQRAAMVASISHCQPQAWTLRTYERAFLIIMRRCSPT